MPYQNERVKSQSFDEYYTPYDQVELFLGELRDSGQFKDIKSICCPCDGARSNIVKWLQKNTSAKIVFFDYLDCNSSKARQKMLQCGCVITNPPFSSSSFTHFFAFLLENNLKYFIWGPYLQNGHLRHFIRLDKVRDFSENFDRPDGSQLGVHGSVYSNFLLSKKDYSYEPAKTQQFFKGIPVFDFSKNVPKDYFGWMYVPQSFLTCLDSFDYDRVRSFKGVDGKYVRICVRRRK